MGQHLHYLFTGSDVFFFHHSISLSPHEAARGTASRGHYCATAMQECTLNPLLIQSTSQMSAVRCVTEPYKI